VQAFTLVELLLVLTILAILAAIVLPENGGLGPRARRKAPQKPQISGFARRWTLFEVDSGHYPRGKAGLMIHGATP